MYGCSGRYATGSLSCGVKDHKDACGGGTGQIGSAAGGAGPEIRGPNCGQGDAAQPAVVLPRDYLDMALTSLAEDGGPPWLGRERPVPWHHVLRGADTYRLTVEDVAERRSATVTRWPLSRGQVTGRDDLVLLRGRRRSTPTAVARRLEQLGHAPPDDIEFTEPERP